MKYKPAGDIINQVALEVGLSATSDPFQDPNPSFKQLIALANSAGRELITMSEWGVLRRQHVLTIDGVVNDQNGIYDLPDDFQYMIDQTGWQRGQNVPLGGPLSPQEWTYLVEGDIGTSTIYASFRLTEGKLYITPVPVPIGTEISFEYISDLWVLRGEDPGVGDDTIRTYADKPQYPAHMFERLLRLRFLEARGFDTEKAQDSAIQQIQGWIGREKSAPVLVAGGRGVHVRLLDGCNVPDSGFGL
jgi:hypothetical protein